MKFSDWVFLVGVATIIGWGIGIYLNAQDRLEEPRMSKIVTVEDLEKEQVSYEK